MFTSIALLFIILAAFATLCWGVTKLALAEPFKTVLIVVLVLFGLGVLYNFIAGGNIRIGP